MLICAQGHRDVIVLLDQWDPSALKSTTGRANAPGTWSVKEVTTTLWPMSWKRARSCPSDAQRPIHRLLFRSINQVPANRRPASRLLLVRCLWPNVLPSIPCRISTARPSPTTTPATSDGQAWPKLTIFLGEIEIQPVKLCSPLTCFFLAF